MISKELNLKLIKTIPEISKTYFKETSWQDGDETGSHIVYEDVFVPFAKKQIASKNNKTIKRIFDFIEELLDMNDEYVTEVVQLSVLESLIFDENSDYTQIFKFAKEKTLQSIKEIVQDLD